jgi:hypothetical protein
VKPWRAPGLHFAVLGGLLFALRAAWPGAGAQPRALVVVPAAEVERLAREAGGAPDAAALDALVGAWVDEELLVREARALGWQRSDPVVQRRLLQNARFLAGAQAAGDAALLRRAFALGLDQSDLVVRRRLATRMRLALAGAARAAEPSDAELEALLRREPERWREPPRARIAQVFLSRDRRGGALAREAAAALARLRAEAAPPAEAAARSDPSLLPAELPLATEDELAARFGRRFAQAVFALEPGGWRGPLPSSYGLHLVWLFELRPGRTPELGELRGALREAWWAERERAALAGALAELRSRAEVRVEGGAWTPPTSAAKSATASR